MADDEAAVRELIARWDTAWNSHDAKALTVLHAENAETVNRFGKHIIGSAQHEAQFAWLHSGPFKDAQSAPQRIFSLRILRPDVAIVRTVWEMPALSIEGRDVPREDMIVSYVLSKEAGAWLIAGVDLHNVLGAFGQPAELPA